MFFKGLPIVTFISFTFEGRLFKTGYSRPSFAKTIAVLLSDKSVSEKVDKISEATLAWAIFFGQAIILKLLFSC